MSRAKVSAFDCDILRTAFHKAVIEDNIPEDRWRDYAAGMVRDFTDNSEVDPDLLDWIVSKVAGATRP
jgi:hypothetical protein